MHSHELDNLLAPAVSDVLETMFFSETFGPAQPGVCAGDLEAQVAFIGQTSGTVGVRISQASARCLAASFLGESECSLTDAQVAQVVCELTNMLCGRIVSKMASQQCFDLGSPELHDAQVVVTDDALQVQQSFAIELGTLTVSLRSSGSK